MMAFTYRRLAAAVGLCCIAGLALGCRPHGAPSPAGAAPQAPLATACLPGAQAFLKARLRGDVDADLNWADADLSCEGGARPDGRGVRVSIAGPLGPGHRRLRLVFGLGAPAGAPTSRTVPTNLTVILEGEQRLYATLGDDKCITDTLVQAPILAGGADGNYRINARGSCIDQASTLDQHGRLWVERFDFSGRIHLEKGDLNAKNPRS